MAGCGGARELDEILTSRENEVETVGVNDYDITVTVKVVKGDQSYSYTRQYRHIGLYQPYYTLGNSTNVQLKRERANSDDTNYKIIFKTRGNIEVDVTDTTTETLYLRYSMDKDTATQCRFDRITTDNQ